MNIEILSRSLSCWQICESIYLHACFALPGREKWFWTTANKSSLFSGRYHDRMMVWFAHLILHVPTTESGVSCTGDRYIAVQSIDEVRDTLYGKTMQCHIRCKCIPWWQAAIAHHALPQLIRWGEDAVLVLFAALGLLAFRMIGIYASDRV